jgi:hypothetical protein
VSSGLRPCTATPPAMSAIEGAISPVQEPKSCAGKDPRGAKRAVGMPTAACSCARAGGTAQRHVRTSARPERRRFIAYFIVVLGVGGAVNESGGEGERVVNPDTKQAIPGRAKTRVPYRAATFIRW